MMKHRAIFLGLALALCVTPLHSLALAAEEGGSFSKTRTYAGQFTDVEAGAWYEAGVRQAYEYGLMNGTESDCFSVAGTLSVGEVVALSARLHSLYTGDGYSFPASDPWYQSYLDYSQAQEILPAGFAGQDYGVPASRTQFALAVAAALPDQALPAVGTVLDNAIPDVPATQSYAGAVYKLYRAGILTGSDGGYFRPATTIQRSEVAVIVARVADPTLRQANNLQKTTATLYAADGRTTEVPMAEIPNYLSVGWYRSTADALTANPGAVPAPDSKGGSGTGLKFADASSYSTELNSSDSPYSGTTRFEVSARVTKIGGSVFHASETAKLTRIGIPKTVTTFDKEAFYISSYGNKFFNKALAVFCEPGSAAETAAKQAGIKTMAARPVYSSYTGYSCMVTEAERPFYLKAGWYDSPQAAMDGANAALDESINNLITQGKDFAANGDNATALLLLNKGMSTVNSTVPGYARMEQASRDIADQWRNSTACPIGVTAYQVEDNSIGTPEVTLRFWNLSYQPIAAFKVQFDCYDAFGSPARDYGGSYTYYGYSDDENLAPLDYVHNTWALYVQDNTKTIKNIRITQIMFSDGTSWGR